MSEPGDRQVVETLLAVNGLSPTAAEVDELVASYRPTRAVVEVLWAMPKARYEEPAPTFDPRA